MSPRHSGEWVSGTEEKVYFSMPSRSAAARHSFCLMLMESPMVGQCTWTRAPLRAYQWMRMPIAISASSGWATTTRTFEPLHVGDGREPCRRCRPACWLGALADPDRSMSGVEDGWSMEISETSRRRGRSDADACEVAEGVMAAVDED